LNHRKISGSDAWRAAAKHPNARWSDNIVRLNDDLSIVHHTPKFQLSLDDSFFCIGSCFARNVEEHLIYQGVNVLSRRIICPKEEWPNRVNGFVNKFTTQSMTNEVEWAVQNPAIDQDFFEEGPAGWSDLQLCPGVSPVSLERAF
jgi:hypothetical protein